MNGHTTQATGSFSLEQSRVEVGYKRIYRDTPRTTWCIVKPDQPANESIGIRFEATEAQAYRFELKDILLQTTFSSVEGTSTVGSNQVTLTVPGTMRSGLYKVTGRVGDQTLPMQDLTIYGNLMNEGTVVTSNGQGGDGRVSDVHDFTISTFAPRVGEGVSGEQNVNLSFQFALPHRSTVSSIDIYSSHRDQQTPSEVEIYYENDEHQMVLAQTFSNLSWETYLSREQGDTNYFDVRLKTSMHLSQPVDTSKVSVKITKGYHQWTKISINEVMLWGFEISDQFAVNADYSVVEAGTENPIHLTGIGVGEFSDKEVIFKLEKSGQILQEQRAQFVQGSLDTTMLASSTLEAGSYTLAMYVEGKVKKTFTYVIRAPKSYELDLKNHLKAFTSSYTEWRELPAILDNDYTNVTSASSVKLWNKWVDVHHPYSLREVKIYAQENSFNTVDVKLGLDNNSSAAFKPYYHLDNLAWLQDDHGSYTKIYLPQKMLAYGVEFVLDREAEIKEIDTEGVYFDTNILEYSKVTLNGQALTSAGKFLDNAVLTNTIFNVNRANNEFIFETTDGTDFSIDHLFLALDHPQENALKNPQFFAWQDGAWQALTVKVSNDSSRSDTLLQMVEYSFPMIHSPKLKIVSDFASDQVRWVELNALGTRKASVYAAAMQIEKADKLYPGKLTLTLENLRRKIKNWKELYSLELASSSEESVISLDGQVHPAKEAKTIQVVFKLIDKATQAFANSKEIEVLVPAALAEDQQGADLSVDYASFYQNPSSGWVIYLEGFESSVYNRFRDGTPTQILNWNARNKGLSVQVNEDATSAREFTRQMDELIAEGLPVQILYIRQPWSWFEPTEGNYAWNNPDSALYVVEHWAREHNIQLAFRIITNTSACAVQAVPNWVFDAGTRSYKQSYENVKNANEPFMDDPIFVQKFDQFVAALAGQYNNEHTAYIDGHGHGQWGEMNANFRTNGDKDRAVLTLQNIFIQHFPDVLLGGQVGSSQGRNTIAASFNIAGPNFVMRRDAFGSDRYLNGDLGFIMRNRLKGIPMFAENVYHHMDSRNFRWSRNMAYSNGSTNEYGGDNPFWTLRSTMDHVVYHALKTGANSIDLRTIEDAKLLHWYGQKYVDRWVQDGGYRISINAANFNKEVRQGEDLVVHSVWQNNGVGIVPNNNKRWNKKMKVAYAILDTDNHPVQHFLINTDEINVGDFEKYAKAETSFDTSQVLEYPFDTHLNLNSSLRVGRYKLAVAVVNTKVSDTEAGMTLANVGTRDEKGYLVLGEFNVTGREITIHKTVDEHGSLNMPDRATVGSSIELTVVPEEGYIPSVQLNGEEVSLVDNHYTVISVPESLEVVVHFTKQEATVTEPDPSNQPTEPSRPIDEPAAPSVEPNTSIISPTQPEAPRGEVFFDPFHQENPAPKAESGSVTQSEKKASTVRTGTASSINQQEDLKTQKGVDKAVSTSVEEKSLDTLDEKHQLLDVKANFATEDYRLELKVLKAQEVEDEVWSIYTKAFENRVNPYIYSLELSKKVEGQYVKQNLQAGEKLTLVFKVPERLKGAENIKLYYVNEELKKLEEVKSHLNQDKTELIANFTHFSHYVLTGTVEVAPLHEALKAAKTFMEQPSYMQLEAETKKKFEGAYEKAQKLLVGASISVQELEEILTDLALPKVLNQQLPNNTTSAFSYLLLGGLGLLLLILLALVLCFIWKRSSKSVY